MNILRVAQFSDGKILLAPNCEANVAARSKDASDAFKFIQLAPSRLASAKARPVGVDILGYVNDSGFKD
jgi:hypothetical protein